MWHCVISGGVIACQSASAVSVSDNFSSPHGDSWWGRDKWLEVTVIMTPWNGNLFLYYRPFGGGIHRWPVDSPHKRSVMRTFDVSFDVGPNKQSTKHSSYRYIETPWRSSEGAGWPNTVRGWHVHGSYKWYPSSIILTAFGIHSMKSGNTWWNIYRYILTNDILTDIVWIIIFLIYIQNWTPLTLKSCGWWFVIFLSTISELNLSQLDNLWVIWNHVNHSNRSMVF